jgi:hypothetical protein
VTRSSASSSFFATTTFGSTIVVLMLAFALRPVASASCHAKPAVLVSVWLGDVRRFAVSSSTVAENVIANVSVPEPAGFV